MLIADAYKQSWHGGRDPWYSFYRDKSGQEVDLVYDTPAKTIFWEVKATRTFNPALLKTLKKVRDQFTDSIEEKLIYGADEAMTVNDTEIIPWNKVNWPD